MGQKGGEEVSPTNKRTRTSNYSLKTHPFREYSQTIFGGRVGTQDIPTPARTPAHYLRATGVGNTRHHNLPTTTAYFTKENVFQAAKLLLSGTDQSLNNNCCTWGIDSEAHLCDCLSPPLFKNLLQHWKHIPVRPPGRDHWPPIHQYSSVKEMTETTWWAASDKWLASWSSFHMAALKSSSCHCAPRTWYQLVGVCMRVCVYVCDIF